MGSTTCAICPPASSAPEASIACACDSGYYMSRKQTNQSSACLACPSGASCDGADPLRTATTLRSSVGYWRVPSSLVASRAHAADAAPVFLKCPLETPSCPSSTNSSCAQGYRGVLCGVCERGYHATGSACTVCVGSNQTMLPILAGVIVIVGAILVYIAKRVDTSKMVSTTKVLGRRPCPRVFVVWLTFLHGPTCVICDFSTTDHHVVLANHGHKFDELSDSVAVGHSRHNDELPFSAAGCVSDHGS